MEMNIHLAQSIQARNELEHIANVQYQIVSVKNSSPIIGCQQDTLSGAYMLTDPRVKMYGWEIATILANTTSETKFNIDMNKLYNGHEIFSYIIPVGINMLKKSGDKTIIEIVNGQLKSGYLDSTALSNAKNSIIHFIWDKFGPNKTKRFIDDSQRLILHYLLYRGQTVGFKDILLNGNMGEQIDQLISNKLLEYKYNLTQFENDSDQYSAETVEKSLMDEVNLIMPNVGQMLMKHYGMDNFFWIAAESKAKGDAIKIAQMSGTVGQQNIEGTRVKKRIEGRTMIQFHRDDDTPEARGFIKNSYLKGMKGYEFFFNAMAGREGLIDTAIKSVTWDTPIVIIENGKPKYTEIGKWIDNHIDNNKDKIKHEEYLQMELLDITQANNNVYIPTMDYDGNVSWGTITAITRHDPGNTLYEIKTSAGRNVTVTESKSLLIWNDETQQFKEVLTPEIKVGDYVPVTLNLPNIEQLKLVDINCDVYESNNMEDINWFVLSCAVNGIYGKITQNGETYRFTKSNDYKQINDVVLDKIVEINLISVDEHPKMYDLTIPETFNFGLANGLQVRDTAQSGYIQRQLIKGLEDLSIKYDGTNRNARGLMIQMVYGENGINQALQSEMTLRIMSMDNKTVQDKLCFSDAQLKKLGKNQKELKNFNDMYEQKLIALRDEVRTLQYRATIKQNIMEDKFVFPVNLFRITQDYSRKREHIELDPNDIVEGIENFLTDYENRLITVIKPSDKFMKKDDRSIKFLLEVALYEYLAPVKCIFEYGLTKDDFTKMMKEIKMNFIKSIIEPGEMVGIIAAQSIGETTSQMTLNTKHSAGVAGKGSANMGVNRIQELLHYSKNIKTPQMSIYFDKSIHKDRAAINKISSYFKHLTIRQLISSAEIYYDVAQTSNDLSEKLKQDKVGNPFYINGQKADILSLPFVFRIKMDLEKMMDKETSLLDIKTKIVAHWYKHYNNVKLLNKTEKDIIGRIGRCVILSNAVTDPEQIIHIRFNMVSFDNNIIIEFLRMIFDDITLKGIENIDAISIDHESLITFNPETGAKEEDKEFMVTTSGINFDRVRMIKGVDLTRTKCNDINTIIRMYGIEAGRQILIYELNLAFEGKININHLAVIIDQMCHSGDITSIDRHGLSKIDIDPIARASFEKTMDHFVNAALFNEKDMLKSVSSRVAVGRVISGGTGTFDLLLDTKKLENSEYTEDESGGRVTFAPLEEEPLLKDIMKHIGKSDFFIPRS
jgi:DNA-directed RNA polymerase beta' subunit